jgi:glycosyltransferase involved in cell wall biosynthesis
VFAVPGDLATPTGGYAYDRRIIDELRALGWRVTALDLGEGFPFPSAATRAEAERRLAALPASLTVVDGLAFGVLAGVAQTLRATHRLVALVHHPLALEAGLSTAQAEALRDSERMALACARHTVTVSEANRRRLAGEYGVPTESLSVVLPGTDRIAPASRERHDGPVTLLAVGSIVPRKGYDVLVAALARLADLPWHLTIVGDESRDRAASARLAADIARYGLGARVRLAGALKPAQLSSLYAAADVFVLPSRLEGYGMVFAEAMAHGLPIVSTTAPAIPEIVPAEAGTLVPPDDVAALAVALREVVSDPDRRRALAAGARTAALRLPTWRDAGQRFAAVLASVA